MEFLAKAAYYAGTFVSGLVVTFFFLANVFGPRLNDSGGRELAVLLVAGFAGYGLLYLAVRFGHQRHQWLTGLALALLALVAAGALMVFGLLVFGKVHWQ
jgi:hypothetical protein